MLTKSISAGSNKLFTSIWIWLVVLTLIEIFLAYKPMQP